MEKLSLSSASTHEQPHQDEVIAPQAQIEPVVRTLESGEERVTGFREVGIGTDGKPTSRFMSKDEVHAAFDGLGQTTAHAEQAEESLAEAKSGPKHLAKDNTEDPTESLPDFIKESVLVEHEPKHLKRPKHIAHEEDPVESLPDFIKKSVLVDKGEYQPKHLKREETSEQPEPTAVESIAEQPENTPEPTENAKQLDNQLRGMISEYRKTKAGMTDEERQTRQGAINDVFDQLALEAGWNEDQLNKKQVMLFDEMAKNPTPKGPNVFEKAVRQAKGPQNPDETKAMNEAIEYLTSRESTIEPKEKVRFAKIKKLGRGVMRALGFGPVEVNTNSPAYQARERVSSGTAKRPVRPASQAPQPDTKPANFVPGTNVRINAPRAGEVQPKEDEPKTAA